MTREHAIFKTLPEVRPYHLKTAFLSLTMTMQPSGLHQLSQSSAVCQDFHLASQVEYLIFERDDKISRFTSTISQYQGFPDSSVGKESACNAGNPSSIPRSGRSAGVGIGYPLQYSWASLVAQLVKNLPAMQETWVRSLGWEDPVEKGTAAHSSILAGRIPWTVQSMGSQRVGHN